MGAKDVLNRFLGHVTAKRDNAASFMASLPGAPGSTMESSQPLSQDQLEKLYRTNWIARKVCDLYASDMVSAGVEWDTDADTSELLEKEFRRLQVWGALEQAVKLARLYGGSIILMGTAAPDPMKPLNTGEALLGLRGFDRYEAKPPPKGRPVSPATLRRYFVCVLCRTVSNRQMPLATETLRLSTVPSIGIFASSSHLLRVSCRSPSPSAPSTQAKARFWSKS